MFLPAGTPWHHKGKAIVTVTCKSSKRLLLLPEHVKYTAEDFYIT